MDRKTKKYIILLLAITLLFFILGITDSLVNATKGLGLFSMYRFLILQFAVYCAAGMIFGLENLLNERNQNGCWKINLSRLSIIGIPSFIIGIYYILYYTFIFIPPFISLIFINYGLFVNLMQMLFGYTVVTSFYKAKKIPSVAIEK
jgi:hypothetical protein